MKVKTTRFGEFEVAEDRIITFPSGIIGFPDEKRYIILDHDLKTPFKWLQSVDNPGLAFVVIDPRLFRPDYNPKVRVNDIAEIFPDNVDDLVVMAIVSIPYGNAQAMTANLQGPLIVNASNMLGRQVILTGDEYHTRHRIVDEMQQAALKFAEEIPESEDVGEGKADYYKENPLTSLAANI